ncbi:hypothetical protein B0J13DRAFT_636740 [Dactylonectria estremocensis]|uniref:Uncharacterized protein n=1 Tax=Dactylonectria estremocensis TaxID=1079267 RepID=A0A9P9ET09_9HYPO|nr:hypothetical protein B0J13DRAFT_636740 [Dactylonectria estremocensis]
MVAREVVVVVLNQTNEELGLQQDSPHLEHGEWMTMTESPPQQILAGESGMWRCQARHIGTQIEGSVTYRIVGYGAANAVTFAWKVSLVEPNKFRHICSAEEFDVRIISGGGLQAVGVFVFEPAKPLD